MLAAFAEEMRERRTTIKDAWERRLRRESVTSPLANPDTLVMMMDSTLEEFFDAVERDSRQTAPHERHHRARESTGCLCGLNPLLAYFRTLGATICAIAASSKGPCGNGGIDQKFQCLGRAMDILREIARRDIAAFCAVCQSEISVGQRAADRRQ